MLVETRSDRTRVAIKDAALIGLCIACAVLLGVALWPRHEQDVLQAPASESPAAILEYDLAELMRIAKRQGNYVEIKQRAELLRQKYEDDPYATVQVPLAVVKPIL